MTSPSFLFCICQVGAEAAVSAALLADHPRLRRAFARPGFLTFKVMGAAPAPELDHPLVRAYGFSLGTAAIDEVFAAVDKTCPVGQAVRLHVFERDIAKPGDEPPGHNYGPLAQRVHAQLAAAWPACNRPLLAGETAGPGDWVLDVIVAEGEPWWLGYHRHAPGHAPTPGGRLAVTMPTQAPSRAYRKLEEALVWSGAPVQAGDVAVELGCAPGGASYALLRRGVTVYGIDPGAMAEVVTAYADATEGPKFFHLQRRMSQVQRSDLPERLHWVVMDVNMAPQVGLISVRRLAARPRPALMGVLLTLKLDDWRALKHLPRWQKSIEAMGMAHVRISQLPSNRMELFAYGLTDAGLARCNATLATATPSH